MVILATYDTDLNTIIVKNTAMQFDYKQIQNIEFEFDGPNCSDAYVTSATYNGVPMSEAELETLNEDRCFVEEKAFDHLH